MSDDLSIPVRPTYRVPRRRGMDPATRRLVLIAVGLGGTLMGIAGAWSVIGHSGHGVPVVQADAGPVRVKPANPGGLQVAGAGNDIFSGGSDTGVDKLAPAAEVPNPQALRAPPPPPKPAPAPAATAAAGKPAVVAAPKPGVTAAPIVQAASRPAVVAESESHPAPAQEKHAATASERVAAKSALVQLAALSSEEAAKTEWHNLSKRMPDLLAGHQPSISKVEHSGHTFWRVRTGGFTDTAQATSFCARVRAKGSSCAVADF